MNIKGQRLNAMAQAWSRCNACPRLAERKNMVFGDGNPDADVVIVGEAPGRDEDASGNPFVGRAGNFLDLFLGQASARPEVIEIVKKLVSKRPPADDDQLRSGLRAWLYQDFFYTNTVMCRPPENTDPIPKEIHNCNSRLMETIYLVDPIIIIAVGRVSAETLLRAKSANISKVRGDVHDITVTGRESTFTYPVMPIFHPAYLLRKNDFNNEDGDAKKTYEDILRVMHLCDELKFRNDGIPRPDKRPPLR